MGYWTGPRKKRTLYIADAKQATGKLIAEIQIGSRIDRPRMLNIIESSARYAQAMKAAARQRQHRRIMMGEKALPPHPHPPPPPTRVPNTISP